MRRLPISPIFLTSLIFLLLLPGVVAAEELPRTAGIHQQTIRLGNDITLRYTLSIPETLEADQPAPLVLALHYGGTVTPFYGKGILTQLVAPALHDLGAVIVAPDCPAGSWTTMESEASVMLLLAELMQYYAIDKSHILVTGYSMGESARGILPLGTPTSSLPPFPSQAFLPPASPRSIRSRRST